jgi:hypothetical protein
MQNVIHRSADSSGFQGGFAEISRLLATLTWLALFHETLLPAFFGGRAVRWVFARAA